MMKLYRMCIVTLVIRKRAQRINIQDPRESLISGRGWGLEKNSAENSKGKRDRLGRRVVSSGLLIIRR